VGNLQVTKQGVMIEEVCCQRAVVVGTRRSRPRAYFINITPGSGSEGGGVTCLRQTSSLHLHLPLMWIEQFVATAYCLTCRAMN
jgi:hypothetical protein